MQRLFLLTFFLFCQLSIVFTQQNLTIGQWKTHLPYREANSVTQNDQYIIISTGRALIYIDKDDLSHQYIDKLDGLSETLISKVVYDHFNQQLIIAYTNSNIDIVKDGSVFNVSDIKENSVIIGSREIYDISVVDASTCYFSTNFGIIHYDLLNKEFVSTTFTDFTINGVVNHGGYTYAATADGLYRIASNSPVFADFSEWQFLSGDHGLGAAYVANLIKVYQDKLFVVINDDLYVLNDEQFIEIDIEKPSSNFDPIYLSADGSYLMVGLRDNGSSSTVRFVDTNGNVFKGGADCVNRLLYGIQDQMGRCWYADEWRQIRYTDGIDFGCNRLEFDSPFAFECSQIEVGKNKVFFASGGARENFSPEVNRSGLYVYDKGDGTYFNINTESYPEIEQRSFQSFITCAPHPKNEDEVFIGSYLRGVTRYNFTNDMLKFYSVDNSSIQTTIGDPSTSRINYIKFDKDENLWMSNFSAPRPISVFTKDSVWVSFSVPGLKELSKFTIDQRNHKWFAIANNAPYVLVMNHGSDILDPTDDVYKEINSSNSILSGKVNCIEVDLDGDIWVGTTEGPVIFDCDIFSNNGCQGTRRKVLEDSIVAFLLETEDILAIEIDGANRKWFGTRNGIFVQSADGFNQELRFNTENSPLLDNTVTDMDYDGETGIMYIATKQGMQSFKTDNLTGGKTHVPSNVYAYPNPVKPDYDGPIAIKGLVRDANVKITDLNGKLIFETEANGGQAIWNGRDYNGNKAAPGVYLVFSAGGDFDTIDAYTTKIMIIN